MDYANCLQHLELSMELYAMLVQLRENLIFQKRFPDDVVKYKQTPNPSLGQI